MNTKITKIGNSKALALEEADEVELSYDQTTQILAAVFPKTKQLKLTDR